MKQPFFEVNAQTRALLNAIHNPIIAIDAAGKVVFLNLAGERIIGASLERWRAKPDLHHRQFAAFPDPADRAAGTGPENRD